MSVPLSQLFADINDKVRSTVSGTLDNNKRTRAINRVLQDLQDYADWFFTLRTKTFALTATTTHEYSLETDFACTCLDNDGTTAIPDFKSPYQLRFPDESHTPYRWVDARTVRTNINRNKLLPEFAIDGDTIIIGRIPSSLNAELQYFSKAMVLTNTDAYQLEFNSDSVTQTDKLLGESDARRTVVQGSTYELFELIGGKSERDRTDSFKIYEQKKKELLARNGRPIRRPIRVLDFAR